MLRWLDTRLMAPEGDDPGAGGDGDKPAGDKPAGDDPTLLAAARGEGDKGGDGDKPAGDGDPGEWFWGEEVAGTGTPPPWLKADKYKTVADQAKAAVELEAKLGPAAEILGAPEGDYEMPPIPEGVEGEWDLEDPMLETFRKIAKAKDLSQATFNEVVSEFGQLLAKEEAEAKATIEEQISKIGTNAVQRMQAVDTYLAKELKEDQYKAIDEAIGTDLNAYLAVESLVAQLAGDAQLSSLPGKKGLGFSKADIEAEQYKLYPEGHQLAGKRVYDHDKAHRAKVDGMWKELFPGEDVQEVG